MTLEENKMIVRKWIDAVNSKDYATFGELMVPEQAISSKQGIPRAYEIWPNHHIEMIHAVAEGDQVWTKCVNSADHGGEVEGIPPTGKHWSTEVVFFFHIVNARIATWSVLADGWDIYRQLGATLMPPKS